MADLTEEQAFTRFQSMLDIMFHQPNNKMVPGTCDWCGADGLVWMRSVDGPRIIVKIEAACEQCCPWKKKAATA